MTENFKSSIDILTGKLIGLSRAVENNKPLDSTNSALLNGLSTIHQTENNLADFDLINEAIEYASEEKHRLVPDCSRCAMPCGRTDDYDMKSFYDTDDETIAVKTDLLKKLKKLSVEAIKNQTVCSEKLIMFIYKSLTLIGYNLDITAYSGLIKELDDMN